MNAIVKQSNLATALKEEVAELGGSGFGTMLKFDANTQKYTIIGGNEVPIGTEYIAHVDQYARGYVKFVDKRPVDVKVFKLTDGKPPERQDLDEVELAGTDDDPWTYQRYLLLENVKTGELVTFVGKSVGSKIALSNLLETFELGTHEGLPIIKLGIGTFPTKEYGRKPRPDFKIINWTGDKKAVGKNDRMIEVKAEDPPDEDPADPWWNGDEEDPNFSR